MSRCLRNCNRFCFPGPSWDSRSVLSIDSMSEWAPRDSCTYTEWYSTFFWASWAFLLPRCRLAASERTPCLGWACFDRLSCLGGKAQKTCIQLHWWLKVWTCLANSEPLVGIFWSEKLFTLRLRRLCLLTLECSRIYTFDILTRTNFWWLHSLKEIRISLYLAKLCCNLETQWNSDSKCLDFNRLCYVLRISRLNSAVASYILR